MVRCVKKCHRCGRETWADSGAQKYCSLACAWASKVKRSDSGCWEWQGETGDKGHGRLNFREARDGAHRVAYQLFNGPIGDKWVLHTCHSATCVNPEHLYLGDHQQNMQDRMDCGNYSLGEDASNRKATEEDVRQIRQLRSKGATWAALSEQFGLSKSTIGQIVNRQTWHHVE